MKIGLAKMAARSTAWQAASGRLAYQRCSVDGWQWRMDFSRAEAALMASSGRATSIGLLAVGLGRREKTSCKFDYGERWEE